MASCCVVVELRTFADVHVISASFADVLTALTLMPVRRQVITSLIATVSAHRPPPAGWLKPGRNYKIIIKFMIELYLKWGFSKISSNMNAIFWCFVVFASKEIYLWIFGSGLRWAANLFGHLWPRHPLVAGTSSNPSCLHRSKPVFAGIYITEQTQNVF